MCGICGIVNFNVTEPVDRFLIERMTDAQQHRGPDDFGYFVQDNVGLGHRRLSIIDLSGGKQPIFNEDGSVLIVFNGEIYNYAELTAELAALGHQFKTHSDTEAIVHAYEEYGDNCVQRFRGMFAFAIWDRRRRRLLLARDRLGIKPVYYYADASFIAFASEIKSLLQDPRVPREVDQQALDAYLALRYVPGPRTMFKNIFKLQPGHSMVVDSSGLRIRKYWDIVYGGTRSTEGALEEFEHLVEESVRLRLIAEVPLGVFLSGGMDSTTMLAVMSKITGRKRIKTFCVGYHAAGQSLSEADDSNEFAFAREAAAHFGAEHYEYRVTASEFRDAIPAMASHLDEPMADPSCIPLYFLSKLARKHITVVLSGEGADEILAGYALYQKLLRFEKVRRYAGPLSSIAMAFLPIPAGNRYRGVVKQIPAAVRRDLIGLDRFDECEQQLHGIFETYLGYVSNASFLNRMLYADAKVWLPENLLLKADKMTMAAAIELRVPFLDHKLVEFSATLPDSLKIRAGNGKWILRQAMSSVLPPSILHRTKKGFPSPTASWLRFELRDDVRDTLLASGSACRRFFDAKAVEEVIRQHEFGKTSGYQEVWSLLVFEAWHKHFIEGFRPAMESKLQGYCVENSF